MSKTGKLARNIAAGVAALAVLGVVAVFLVVRTEWFRAYVQRVMIADTENATGGRVDIRSFRFDLTQLRATVDGFVIHGSEPPGSAPYLQVRRIVVQIRPLANLHRVVGVSYLGVDGLEANIISYADGTTNVPKPKTPSAGGSPLATIVDIAIGRFELANGAVTFSGRRQALDIRGTNLRAQLTYSTLTQNYQGRIQFDPIYVASGNKPPVKITVSLPLGVGRDRIELKDARIFTPDSALAVNGVLENLRDPQMSLRIKGHIALADVKNGGNIALHSQPGSPTAVDVNADVKLARENIQVMSLNVGLGSSSLAASGTLKGSSASGALAFQSHLAIGELRRLADLNSDVRDGVIAFAGKAKLGPQNRRIELHDVRLAGLGVELRADASLEDFMRYQLRAVLGRVDLRQAEEAAGTAALPYDGALSGTVEASGSLRRAAENLNATVRLSIDPIGVTRAPAGSPRIPVTGRVNATYHGAGEEIEIDNSFIALPHTRLTFSGSINRGLHLALTTTDLTDMLATVPALRPGIAFQGGSGSLTGDVTGRVSSPQINGHVALNRFVVEDRFFDSLSGDVSLSNTSAVIRNGALTRDRMQAGFSGAVALRNWKAPSTAPITLDATLRMADFKDVIALAGYPSRDYSGDLAAEAHIRGTLGNPAGDATIQVSNGTLAGEPFDRLHAETNLSNQLVVLSNAVLESKAGSVAMRGEFHHPADSFFSGDLRAHVQSDAIDLSRVATLRKQRANTSGTLQWSADASARLSPANQNRTAFALTGVTADGALRGFHSEGQDYGDVSVGARTNGQSVAFHITSDFAGSNVRITGTTELAPDYPTKAEASLSNLPVERLLVLAHRSDIAAKGNLSGTLSLRGTPGDPQGTLDLNLSRGVLYAQPLDQFRIRAEVLPQRVNLDELQVASGTSRIELTACYDHPAGNLRQGKLQWQVSRGRIDLAGVKTIQQWRPDLTGLVNLEASGAGEIQSGDGGIALDKFDADVKAANLRLQGKPLGDLTMSAKTEQRRVVFTLDSNVAQAAVHGSGNAQLTRDFPIDAQIAFRNVAWSRISGLVQATAPVDMEFDAQADGVVTLQGPARNVGDLNTHLQLTRLELTHLPAENGLKSAPPKLTIQNQGPIALSLRRGLMQIESLHLSGPQTDIQASGALPLRGGGSTPAQALANLSVKGNMNLAVLHDFNSDVVSAGSVTLATNIRGVLMKPQITGQAELHNASLNDRSLPNGISNANGTIQFNGNNATVRNLTAESGGGKLTLGGFVSFQDTLHFGLRLNASRVRMRFQPGVSIVSDANVNVSGSTDASLATGTVTIVRVSYTPQTDLGAILTRAVPDVESAAPSPIFAHLRLDVRVQTTAGTTFQSTEAENVQADADLQILGSAANPGATGRVSVTRGQLVFFGSTYSINTGSVSFYNPSQIQPYLDLSLETQAQGVDVVLKVTGPVDNMQLSYTSDPPLQFQEIVALLAAGTTPTSDPTLLANQPAQPPQSFQQTGESAVLGKAIANPVASRLQRVFGVSQLSINPTFAGGSDLPQAQLTLRQKVTSNMTFTYITDVNGPNATTVRVDLALNQRWSANVERDLNGIVSVNILYKRQVR